MAAHQETSQTFTREGQECSTKEQTEDMPAHQETSQTFTREGQESRTKEQTEDWETPHRDIPESFDREDEKCSTKEQTKDTVKSEGVQQETKDGQIERLQQQLDQTNTALKKFKEENQKLRAKKEVLERRIQEDQELKDGQIQALQQELEEAKLTIKNLTAKIDETSKESDELKVKLKGENKTFRKKLQQKGEVCEMNCVICVVTFICRQKLENVHLCCRHLEKIIVHYAAGQTLKEYQDKKYLGCAEALRLLRKCKIVFKELSENYMSRMSPNEIIDEVWKILSTKNAKVMILARKSKGTPGHTIVCDLEDKTEDNRLTFYDPQKDEKETRSKEDFRKYVKDDRGIILCSIDLEHLKKIIDENRDMSEEICCNSGANRDWKATPTDMFPVNASGEVACGIGNDVSAEPEMQTAKLLKELNMEV